jgi:hypothetical protein
MTKLHGGRAAAVHLIDHGFGGSVRAQPEEASGIVAEVSEQDRLPPCSRAIPLGLQRIVVRAVNWPDA